MSDPMRVRATESGGVVDVKILMKHDMETGQRKDASGKAIPAWFKPRTKGNEQQLLCQFQSSQQVGCQSGRPLGRDHKFDTCLE